MKAVVPTNDHGVPVLFIADSTTLNSPDHPILVVDLRDSSGRPPFRCLWSELWGVDDNLNIANMDWDEFAGGSTKAEVSAASAHGPQRVFAVSPVTDQRQLRMFIPGAAMYKHTAWPSACRGCNRQFHARR